MKRKPPAATAENCGLCPALVDDSAATLSVSGFAAIPSRLVAQVTDGVWNAVMTTRDKGTLIIRCPQERSIHACLLKAYDVRHVAADPPRGRNRPGDQAVSRAPEEACRDPAGRIGTGRISMTNERCRKEEELG